MHNTAKGLFTPKTRVFFFCGYSAADISKSHIFKWDPLADEVFGGSVKFADGKTSSANVPHLNVWDFAISAAEFPQPKKTRVFSVNRPYSDQRRTFFSAAEILLRI